MPITISVVPFFKDEITCDFILLDTSLEISLTIIPKELNLFEKLIKCCLDNNVVGTKTKLCILDLAARNKALKILDNLEWENKYYRKDIGYRVIDK